MTEKNVSRAAGLLGLVCAGLAASADVVTNDYFGDITSPTTLRGVTNIIAKCAPVNISADLTLDDRTFGLPDEAVDAKRFAALRENYPMAARNMSSEVNALAFYPAINCPLRIKTKNHAETIRHDATKHLLGSFFVGLDKRLGVNTRAMHYEIAFEGPDGFKAVYGNNSVSEKQTLPAMLAAMEAKWPERKGKISTRDIMNLYYLGAVTFRGVNTTPPAPNAKK